MLLVSSPRRNERKMELMYMKLKSLVKPESNAATYCLELYIASLFLCHKESVHYNGLNYFKLESDAQYIKYCYLRTLKYQTNVTAPKWVSHTNSTLAVS